MFPSPVSSPKNISISPTIEIPLKEEQINGKAITEEKGPIALPPSLLTSEPSPEKHPIKEASKPTGTSKLLAEIQAGKSLKPT